MSNADLVLRRIEEKADKEALPIIGPKKGKILAQEARNANPKNVLEVGTLIGYSTILIGKELDKNAKIITIEIHSKEAKAAEKNVRDSNISPKVKVMVGNALKVIPTLNESFDFAFIDAEKKEYLQYLQLAEDKLLQGTVIVADNAGIFAKQMSNYLNYVRNSGKYQSRFLQVDWDGLEISVKL